VKPEKESFFKITYEDEFQTVDKLYKLPTSVCINVPVEVFAEVLIAAGYHPKSVSDAFENYAQEWRDLNDCND
jgi:hypothetical protein